MPARGREVDVIDASVPLLSHDYKHLYLRDVMGRRGLIVVGVGRAGERGFQMLYRFSDICDRLEECGVNVIFVYQKESARHVLDATSLLGGSLQAEAISASGRRWSVFCRAATPKVASHRLPRSGNEAARHGRNRFEE
jgi:hypothetical protein